MYQIISVVFSKMPTRPNPESPPPTLDYGVVGGNKRRVLGADITYTMEVGALQHRHAYYSTKKKGCKWLYCYRCT